MKVDPKFKEHVLESDQLYITFKNEFEIYAGLSRSDEAFLDAIFEKSKVIFESLNTEFDTLSLDKSLNVRARILTNYERKMMELSRKTRSLTFEELDELDELANELDIDTQTIEGVKQKQAIFQTFWKIYSCTKSLFFELETSNCGYLLVFSFPLTVQSFSKIGQH